MSTPTLRHPTVAGAMVTVVAAVIGAGVVIAPFPTMGAIALVIVASVLFTTVRRANVTTWALAAYGVLIAMPALLPRTGDAASSAASGGALDQRALAQLAVVLAMFAVGCLLWLVSGGSIRTLVQPPLRLVMLYIAVIGVSLLYAPDIGWSAYGMIKLLALVPLLAILAVTIDTDDGVTRVVDAMLGAITVVLALYWLDVARGAATVAAGRVEVTWLGPNHLTLMAVTLTTVMTIRFLLASDRGSGTPRTVLLGLLGAGTALASGSKASLGAAAIALVLVVGIVTLRRLDVAVLGRMVAMAMALVLVLAYFIVSDSGIVAHLGAYGANENIDPMQLTGRVPVWNSAIDQTLGSLQSTVIGHGYLSTFAYGLIGSFWVATQAHNAFIQTFFDLGLVGLLVVGAIYLQAWRRSLRDVMRLPTSDKRWARAVELFALLVMLTVVSMVEDVFGGVVESRAMVFLLVVFCLYRNREVTPGRMDDAGPVERGAPARANPARP